jgi:hypothetical protein
VLPQQQRGNIAQRVNDRRPQECRLIDAGLFAVVCNGGENAGLRVENDSVGQVNPFGATETVLLEGHGSFSASRYSCPTKMQNKVTGHNAQVQRAHMVLVRKDCFQIDRNVNCKPNHSAQTLAVDFDRLVKSSERQHGNALAMALKGRICQNRR